MTILKWNTLVVFLISIFINACSHQALKVKTLDDKANYKPTATPALQLLSKQGGPHKLGPKRVASKEKVCWYYPHEMSSKDYFLGGWIRLVYDNEHWDETPADTSQKGDQSKH